MKPESTAGIIKTAGKVLMKREELIKSVSSKLKLIRTEYGVTQEEMSEMLGVSKKTLVETEKGRRDLSWTETIAVASVFEKSEVLQGILGGDSGDVIHALAFEDRHIKYPATMGGKVWWHAIDEKYGIRLQQNFVTGHYRLLDAEDCRLISSFSKEEVEEYRESIGRK